MVTRLFDAIATLFRVVVEGCGFKSLDERNKEMNRIPTMKEIREYRLTHLWSDTLDQIFDMRDH